MAEEMAIGQNAAAEIKAFLDRAEHVEGEIADLRENLKEIFIEARGRGFDPKALKRLIALRRKKEDIRREEAAILGVYAEALQFELFNGA